MSWMAKPFPLIPGYDSLGNATAAKWWLGQTLDNWLDRAPPVPQLAAELETRDDVCKFIIERFEYPMVRGIPNDKHVNNWFSGMECYQITLDYWQKASETLRTLLLSKHKEGIAGLGTGDCEDTSMAFTALFLEKGWKAMECIGMVYQDGQLLGGHGWAIFQLQDGQWALYESTLDDVPSTYPLVSPADNDWQVGEITYHAEAKFDRSSYYEWDEAAGLGRYLAIPARQKESRAKYQAIERVWRVRTKPTARAGFMSKLRWR